MIYRTSTNCLPIINVGLYWSGIYEALPMDMTSEESTELKNEICELAKKHIQESLNNVFGTNLLKVSDFQFCSPKYYNFEDDSVEFNINISEMDYMFLKDKYIRNEDFWKWAKNSYGSRDGFISFMPYTKEVWNNSRPEDEWRKLSMILMFALNEHNFDFKERQNLYELDLWDNDLYLNLRDRAYYEDEE